MKKLVLMCLIGSLWTLTSKSQSVHLDFIHFAGKDYTYVIVEGAKIDTIATGKLDAKGKTTLTIPAKYKGYVGMSHFSLTEGGGLDMIIGKENFTVRCSEAQPNESNIEYINSRENDFFRNQFQKQQKVLVKADIIQRGLQVYTKTENMYAELEKEQQALNEQFKAIQLETAKSPLYAARFLESIDYSRGIGASLIQTPEQKQVYLAAYVRAKLDLQALYTSNNWAAVLQQWYDSHENNTKGDSIRLDDAKYMAARIKDNKIYTAFAGKVVAMMAAAGKDELMYNFGTYIAVSNRAENPDHNLTAAMGGVKTGMHAPEIILPDGKQMPIKSKTVLLFYESGCNNCENELLALRGNYEVLKSKGYDVITIASDRDKATNEKTISVFPWTKKYCDLKGHAGLNFSTYAVIGTPTFFVIDDNGTIAGQYARLADANILN